MAYKSLNEIEPDERGGFESVCADHGLACDDFEFAMEEQYPAQGIGHIRRVAHIKRKGAIDGRTCAAGSGSDWNGAFKAELVAGIHGVV